MKPVLMVLGLVVLAACGANGGPVTPSAAVGVSVGTGGVSTGAAVGVSTGNVRVGVSR